MFASDSRTGSARRAGFWAAPRPLGVQRRSLGRTPTALTTARKWTCTTSRWAAACSHQRPGSLPVPWEQHSPTSPESRTTERKQQRCAQPQEVINKAGRCPTAQLVKVKPHSRNQHGDQALRPHVQLRNLPHIGCQSGRWVPGVLQKSRGTLHSRRLPPEMVNGNPRGFLLKDGQQNGGQHGGQARTWLQSVTDGLLKLQSSHKVLLLL